MSNDRWDVPRRDLLDLERTAHVESIEAADHLADVADALLAELPMAGARKQPFVLSVRQAVRAYRIARGLDTE